MDLLISYCQFFCVAVVVSLGELPRSDNHSFMIVIITIQSWLLLLFLGSWNYHVIMCLTRIPAEALNQNMQANQKSLIIYVVTCKERMTERLCRHRNHVQDWDFMQSLFNLYNFTWRGQWEYETKTLQSNCTRFYWFIFWAWYPNFHGNCAWGQQKNSEPS